MTAWISWTTRLWGTSDNEWIKFSFWSLKTSEMVKTLFCSFGKPPCHVSVLCTTQLCRLSYASPNRIRFVPNGCYDFFLEDNSYAVYYWQNNFAAGEFSDAKFNLSNKLLVQLLWNILVIRPQRCTVQKYRYWRLERFWPRKQDLLTVSSHNFIILFYFSNMYWTV